MAAAKDIEVDILEIDAKDTMKKLENLGAKLLFEGQIDSAYFDFPNKSLEKNCKLLRLRKKGKELTLTLKQSAESKKDQKGAVQDSAKEEFEIGVTDFEKAKILLEHIGFIECQTDSRERICYKLQNSSVNINIYDNIPPFLEVKSPSESELKNILKMLGYSMSNVKCRSEKEVVANYEHIYPTTTRMP
jgi:adenylate cyclase, class 2